MFLLQERSQLTDIVCRRDRLLGQDRGTSELFFELFTVGHKDNFEAPQFLNSTHFADQKNHRQAFTGTLSMPDNATALIFLPMLVACGIFQQLKDGVMDCTELVVTGDQLALFAARAIEEREVIEQVEQIMREEHAQDKILLARRLCRKLSAVMLKLKRKIRSFHS